MAHYGENLADLPNHLQPFSIVSDAELQRLRKLEAIAKSYIRHVLRDPSVRGVTIGADNVVTVAELKELLREP